MDDEQTCKCGELLHGADELSTGMCDHCATWLENEYGCTVHDCVEMDEFDDPRDIDDWDLF